MKEPTGYCVSCRKSFSTQKAYDNHLNSKKHKEAAAIFDQKEDKVRSRQKSGFSRNVSNLNIRPQLVIEKNRLNRKESEVEDADDKDMEVLEDGEWEEEFPGGEPIATNCCLFCPHQSKELEKNLIHMMEKHSFFVPGKHHAHEYCRVWI